MMQNAESAYLVQGLYFQRRQLLGLGMHPTMGEVATLYPGVIRDMFAGVVWWDDIADEWQGSLQDPAGYSNLTDIQRDTEMFSFDKHYERRNDVIHYEFALVGDPWIGTYEGPAVGSGYANCILTPVPKEMFTTIPD